MRGSWTEKVRPLAYLAAAEISFPPKRSLQMEKHLQ